jgi:hypothetical protein
MTPDVFTHALVLLIIAIAVVAVIRFEVWCVSDILRTPENSFHYLTRRGWIAVCVFLIPVGAIMYLSFGRDR